MAGLRKALIRISVPISTRSVASASAESIVQQSHMPRVGSPEVRSKKLSGSQRLSKPSASACCATARIDSYERLLLVARSFASKSVSPIFTECPQLSLERRRRTCLLFMRWLQVFTVAVSGVMWLHDRKSRKESSHGAAWERAGTNPGGGCIVDCGMGRDPGADRATLRALRAAPADARLGRRTAHPVPAQEQRAAG